MSVQELQKAIAELAPSEIVQLAEWFDEFHQEVWDRQIERDLEEGYLDELIEQANRAFDAGQCRKL